MNPNALHDTLRPVAMRRQGVNRLLDMAFSSPNINLICAIADAGFGKSRAIAQYLAEKNFTTVWMQLSRPDNFSLRGWERFKYFFNAYPEFEQKLEKMGFPNSPASLSNFIELFSTFLSELRSRLVLVLDDLHLITNQEVLLLIETLIAARLDNLHMVIISRTVIPFKSNLLLQDNCVFIDEDDFRLSRQEVEAFFAARCPHIAKKDIDLIYRDTEGWAFGLDLMAAYLEKEGRKYTRFDFYEMLEAEVFAKYSGTRQRFLIQIALIGTIPYDLMLQLLRANQFEVDELAELSLFLRFDRKNQTYYVHHLLAEFLEKKQYCLSIEELSKMYLLAADWLYQRDFAVDALRCYAKGGRYEKIVEIMPRFLTRVSKEQNRFFLEIFAEVPAQVLAETPLMNLLYALILINDAQADKAYARMQHVKNQYEREGNKGERERTLGEVYIVCALLCMMQRSDDFVRYFKLADAYLPGGSRLITKALPLNGGNYANLVKDPIPGEFDRMEALIFQGMPYASRVMNGSGYGVEYLVAAEGAYHRKELKAAEQHAYKALHMSRMKDQQDIECMACFFLVRIFAASGNYAKVTAFMESFRARVNSDGMAYGFSLFDIAEGWFYSTIGQADKAASWIVSDYENERFLSPLSSGIDKLIRAKCYLAKKDFAELLAILASAKDVYGIQEFLLGRLEILILSSISHYNLGDKEAAMRYFQEAYAMSESNHLIMLFLEYGSHTRTLAAAALKNPDIKIPQDWLRNIQTKSTTYAKQISSMAAEYNRANLDYKGKLYALTNKEYSILECLSNGLTRKQIAEVCNISVNTVKSAIDNIYIKLGAENKLEAIKIMEQQKLDSRRAGLARNE